MDYHLYVDRKISEHEKLITESINSANTLEEAKLLYIYHKNMVLNFQMERLVHLIVTMSVALFTLIMAIVTVLTQKEVFITITMFLLLLLLPYIVHYYRLENGIQKLYKLDKMIIERQDELTT